MTLGQITISTAWAWILAACAAVVTISKAVEVLKKLGKGSIMEKLDNDNKRLKALEDAQDEQEKTNRVLMRALLALVNHGIDGNGIEGLKKTRDELTNHLCEK